MNKIQKPYFFFSILIFVCLNGTSQSPKLIEFGWDYPDVTQLSNGLPKMQNTPFDGICFSTQRIIMEAFDTVLHKEDYFEYTKLKELKWGQYTDNYILLRGYGMMGGSWFNNDLWKIFTTNMTALSKATNSSNAIKGILFDPEYYNENKHYNPWTYSKDQYPNQSFEEVQQQVKKRGAEFIIALQKHKPNLTFISIWLTSLIAEEKKYTAFDQTRHALLIPFIEGIFEGKKSTVTVVDGNEYAYWNFKPSQFMISKIFLTNTLADLMQSKSTKLEALKMPVAQCIFYDGLMARSPSFEKGLDNKTKWNWLEQNTKYAMAATNSLVWFYCEKINCWDGTMNDTLVSILNNAKTAFSNTPISKTSTLKGENKQLYNKAPLTDETAYFYFANEKTPMKTGEIAFTFKWNNTSKKLMINFANKLPQLVTVYTADSSYNVKNPTTKMLSYTLTNFTKGKIIVYAKYEDTLEASAIKIYSK